jgi:hypothetical protein
VIPPPTEVIPPAAGPPPPPVVTAPVAFPPVTPPDDTDKDGAGKGKNISAGIGRFLHQPERNRPVLPDDVKALIQKFDSERDTFLKAQEDLRKQMKDASKDKRDDLREQLRTNREKWLDEQKQLREDIRDRLKELKDTLPSHHDAIDDAKEGAKNHRAK